MKQEKMKVTKTEQSTGITCFQYKLGDEQGWVYMCFPFPNCYLWANDIHMNHIPSINTEPEDLIKINICLSGHCETLLEDGRYVYMEPGMISIDSNAANAAFQYQTSLYQGIEIAVERQKWEESPNLLLEELGLNIADLEQLLQKRKGSYLGRYGISLQAISEKIYAYLTGGEGDIYDYRFLLLQLIYELKHKGITAVERDIFLTRGQREIAQESEKIMTEDLRERHSVEELANRFKVSPSSLKKYFELRFGQPVSVYMRERRMDFAKRQLTQTNRNIIEIAEMVGYSNQGKFCGVFKKQVGVTPLEYRRQNVVV